MKKQQIASLLKSLGAKPKTEVRTGWVVSDCPLGPWKHSDGKSSSEVFGIKEESGIPRCNCFSCGFHGDAQDLVTEVQLRNKTKPSGVDYDFKEAMKLIAKADEEFELNLDVPDVEQMYFGDAKPGLQIFDDWWIESFPLAKDVEFARAYLLDRSIPEHVWEELEIRADPNQGRVCFPVYDFQKRRVGLHGRAVDDATEPRYRMYTYKKRNNPIVWYGEHWVDFSQPVVAVEGPFDVAAVKRVYKNVVSPLYSNPSIEKLKRMDPAFELITLLDRGTGGDVGREKFAWVFKDKTHLLHHAVPPEHRKDPGVMTDDELRDTLGKFIPSLLPE